MMVLEKVHWGAQGTRIWCIQYICRVQDKIFDAEDREA